MTNPQHTLAFLAFLAVFAVACPVRAQPIPQYLGLAGEDLTSLSIYGHVVAVGTDGNGVYYQADANPTPADWNHVALDSLSIETVYAHKSGPLGWAIAAGIKRRDVESRAHVPLVYCSHLGQPFVPRAHGIDSTATQVVALTGFPDPTICGETYAAVDRSVYLRPFGDTTWTPVFEASQEGSIATVVARPQYPGVVVAGGADGFAGHLLVRSTDYGKNWKDISPVQPILSVDFGGETGATIFAGSFGSLHRSKDAGETWDSPLVDANATTYSHMLYDPGHSAVYAAVSQPGTPAQVRYSLDNGDSWLTYDPGVASEIVGMAFGEGTRWLYYATADDGLFRIERTAISVGVDDSGSDAVAVAGPILRPAYPNPFSTRTTLPYTTNRGVVHISIYDALGRVVAHWTRTHASAGQGTVDWYAPDAADGLYLVRVQTERGRATSTIVKRR